MTISQKRKKIFQKEKRHSSVFRKAFQISRKYFSCHIHFKSLQNSAENRKITQNNLCSKSSLGKEITDFFRLQRIVVIEKC